MISLTGRKASWVVVQINSKGTQLVDLGYLIPKHCTNTQTLHRVSLGCNSPDIVATHPHVCHLQNGALGLLLLLRLFFGWLHFLAFIVAGEAGCGADGLSEAEKPPPFAIVGQRPELHLLDRLPLLAFLLQGQDLEQIQTCLNCLDTLCTPQSNVGAASQRQGGSCGDNRLCLLFSIGWPQQKLLLSEGHSGTNSARSDKESSERQLSRRTVEIFNSLESRKKKKIKYNINIR